MHASSSVTAIPPSLLTSQRFLALVDAGVLTPDDAIGTRALVRSQLSLHAGPRSVPEPDVAVVPGSEEDYERAHPSRALLVVEIAETSLATDRLTKAGVYAAAHVPEYWIVNVRERTIEVHREPRRDGYAHAQVVVHDGEIALQEFPDVRIRVRDVVR